MAIARASSGAHLLSLPFASLRRLYSTATASPTGSSGRPANSYAANSIDVRSRASPANQSQSRGAPRSRPRNDTHAESKQHSSGSQQRAGKKGPPLYIPVAASRFLSRNGKLNTTPENWAFLNETKIDFDHSKMVTLSMGEDHTRMVTDFALRVYFSPRNIMHPHHVAYLDPRQHPLGEAIRTKYRRKVAEQPLWLIMAAANSSPGLVRSIGQRRLTAAFWSAMGDLGYKSHPAPGEPSIRGTLYVLIHNSEKAANHPAHRFGEAMAKAVVRESKKQSSADSSSHVSPGKDVQLEDRSEEKKHYNARGRIGAVTDRLLAEPLSFCSPPSTSKRPLHTTYSFFAASKPRDSVSLRAAATAPAMMLVSLTVGKVDAGVTVLLTPDKRLIEFPSILLPPNISSGSIVDITVGQNTAKEAAADRAFRSLQDRIYNCFGAAEPLTPALRCRNATQTSVVLEWDPIQLATADLISLSLYRNGQKAGNIPRPLQMQSTKISGLAVDTEYTFHLVLRTSAGTCISDRVPVRTHKMTDLSGITITTGFLPGNIKEMVTQAVQRIGAKLVDGVRIDTTHFVTTEGRGQQWEKAVESNIPVVRPEWVDACEKNGRILGVTKFYLDAMKPGPPSEDHQSSSTPPPSKPKDLPPPPAEKPEEKKATSPSAPPTAATPEEPKQSAETTEDSSEDDDKVVPEQKAIPSQAAEQKVRLEDVQEQKVALRPAISPREEDQPRREAEGGKDEDEEDDDDDDEEEAKTKPSDGFQEVEL
ncbi:hypothetical protein G7046_g9648 [Stylonectria norvegica]|nr:hypothetical protein G7046_g9648 [Stylonectria norvegica]